MKELSEEEKYIRKAALLKKALADADEMDAALHSVGLASVSSVVKIQKEKRSMT
ncbi:MAG: hypothetical protein ACYDG4_08710 [Desulfuromonadaceae bacterium]